MRTINFFTSHFLPENTACTNRVLSYIDALDTDYKINIICLTEKGKRPKEMIRDCRNNVRVHYVYQSPYNGNIFFLRAFYEIHYVYKMIRLTRRLPADISIATAPYMFIIPLVGHFIKGPKILDIRDLVWEYLSDNKPFCRIVKGALRRIMEHAIRKYDYVTVTNDHEFSFLSGKQLSHPPTLIYNGIDQKRYDKLSQFHHQPPKRFTVTYTGNIGIAQNLITLVDAAAKLPNVTFYAIGDGAEHKQLQAYARSLGMENITFTGKLAWDELTDYYARTSVLYAQLDNKYASAMPSKLYEYAALGLPIVYGGVGQATEFLKQLENATVVPPNDPDALATAIKTLQTRPQSISESNRALIRERYIREDSARRIIPLIEQALNPLENPTIIPEKEVSQ
jgi:glycosyltransferase involved in cell wall biosynthesis